MTNEFNELLQIRNQKESKQRKIVQGLERKLEEKKIFLQTLEQSMELFKTQKTMIENVFFDQISGQQMKPESLSEYQNKVKQIGDFDKELNVQHQVIIGEIKAADSDLAQARQDLITAGNNVEKIGMLVDSEQKKNAKIQSKAEDAQADELAAESWNRSS